MRFLNDQLILLTTTAVFFGLAVVGLDNAELIWLSQNVGCLRIFF